MHVDTVLGPVTVTDLAVPGAEDCFASSVRLGAKEFAAITEKLPELLRPSANVLARMWLGDEPSSSFMRDLELGHNTAAMAAWHAMPWAAGVSLDLVHQAYEVLAESSRSVRHDLLRARKLADQGQCDALRSRVAGRWASKYATRTATMGQYRRQTGCPCPNPMQCQCLVKAGGI